MAARPNPYWSNSAAPTWGAGNVTPLIRRHGRAGLMSAPCSGPPPSAVERSGQGDRAFLAAAMHSSGKACQRRPVPPHCQRVHVQFRPGGPARPSHTARRAPRFGRRARFGRTRHWPAGAPSRRGGISFVAFWVWRAAICARPPRRPRSSLRQGSQRSPSGRL